MIVRTQGEHLLLITQPDHARLAADLARAWRRDDVPAEPRRSILLLATREHDNGWIEPDDEPEIDPETGHPYDFVSAPAPIKQAIWPRGVARLEQVDSLAAAFVAQHALTILADYRNKPEWVPFFDRMTSLRDALLAGCHLTTPDERAAFERDYHLVYLADYLSLVFCNGWRRTFEDSGYRFTRRGEQLLIRPDPFAGVQVPLSVPARRIPNRRFATTEELRQTLAEAESLTVHGTAIGTSKLENRDAQD